MEAGTRGRECGRVRSVPMNRDESRCGQKGRELEDADYRYPEKSTKISFSLSGRILHAAAIPLYPI
jgi:hypothetical protein